MNQSPLNRVVDVKKQWYKFLPKQGEVDEDISPDKSQNIERYKIALDAEKLKGSIS